MAPSNFSEKLDQAWQLNSSLLCVGIDPDPNRFAAPSTGKVDAITDYTKAIIAATAAHSCAYKFQIAHYAAIAAESQLAATISWVKATYPKHIVILDAKRGDVSSTAEYYAQEAFVRYQADAVTLNPYLGEASLAPFLRDPSRGGILLCRTSNLGSGELQQQGEPPLFIRVAQMAARLWQKQPNVGLVIGANCPDDLRLVRQIVPKAPILTPGIGVQQGDLEATLKAGLNEVGTGILVSSSRSICYASKAGDFADAAGKEATRLCEQINNLRSVIAGSAAG